MKKFVSLFFVIILLLFLSGCGGHTPPKNANNICGIFREMDDWYDAANDSYKKWGVPPYVSLAIMHQESRFEAAARPPRKKFLWIFPGARPSSAFGYAQALDGTWEKYKTSTGNSWADRDDFEDAIDFIGWYCDQSRRISGISKHDAYNQYLAYHEGQGGYNRGTYRKKKWLRQVAQKVQNRANLYKRQFRECKKEFENKGWSFWPF
ncbi:MAG: transglycosylase SLT domain-containing protein [Nitrospinae bacterium]|nr:transglycosylase SLT domain-containing protein [Nitrospinota bacterium]